MTGSPLPRDADKATGASSSPGSTTGTPRWVKVFGLLLAVVALLLVIVALFGSGHGPGRHTSSGDCAQMRSRDCGQPQTIHNDEPIGPAPRERAFRADAA